VERPVPPHPDCIFRCNPTSQRERSSSRPRIRLRSSSYGGQERGEVHRARRTILIQTLMPSFSIPDALRACSFLRTAIIHREARELKDAPPRSRGTIARVIPVVRPSLLRRGRRECRVKASPMARLQQRMQAAGTTGAADQPAFPARWTFRLLRALPGAPGLLATIRNNAPLAHCAGHQRRGVETTRLDRPHSAVRPRASRTLRQNAATASPPHVS